MGNKVATTDTPELIFTGQEVKKVIRGSELIVCAKCGDEDDLIRTRGDAWFDSYVIFGENKGAYAHHHCLSEQRKKEIAEGR